MRRYSGFASAKYTLADFWSRYGIKFRNTYKDWFDIDIPEPELDQLAICQRTLQKRTQALQDIKNMAETSLSDG